MHYYVHICCNMVMLLYAIYNVQLLPNINREKTKITGCNLIFETKISIRTVKISSAMVAQYKMLRM
jgi:hypothetical protein